MVGIYYCMVNKLKSVTKYRPSATENKNMEIPF